MSRIHVLAVDPGLKPGVAQFEIDDAPDTERVKLVRVSHRITDEWIYAAPPWDVLATEGQWYYGTPARARTRGASGPDVNDLLKLAFRAGYTLASIPACRRLRIPPQEWRGGSSATKAQVQARISAKLTTAERKLFADVPESRHGDVLDAIGIGRAAVRIVAASATTTPFDWK